MSSSIPLIVQLIRLDEDDPARQSATKQEATIGEASAAEMARSSPELRDGAGEPLKRRLLHGNVEVMRSGMELAPPDGEVAADSVTPPGRNGMMPIRATGRCPLGLVSIMLIISISYSLG